MKSNLIILTIAIFLASLIIGFWLTVFNFNWYREQFTALGVYDQLPKSRVDAQTKNLLAFFQDQAGLDQSFYSNREISHLVDIKNLLAGFKKVSWLVLSIVAGYFLLLTAKQRLNSRILFFSSALAAGAILILAGLIALFFNQLFLVFHQLAFANDYWQLDPAAEKLIVIFPPQLFLDLIAQFLIRAILISLMIALVGEIAGRFFAKPAKF